VWNVKRQKRGSFRALDRPKRIVGCVPIGEARYEVRLRRPRHSVIHRFVIFQTLEQHGVEPRSPNDLSDSKAGKAVEQRSALSLFQNKSRIGVKARNQFLNVVGKFRVTSIHVRQVGIVRGNVFPARRTHVV